MDKKEFEKRAKELNFKKVHKGIFKLRNPDEGDYYIGRNILNIYGCKKNLGEYVIFFKDSERGITTELGRYKTEEEAYEKLLETMTDWEKEHNKDKK